MKLFWLDIETTGLDPFKDQILEIAIATSDLSTPLETLALYQRVLHFDSESKITCACGALRPAGPVNEFVRDMHAKNGLWEECRKSLYTLEMVEAELLALIPKYEGDREDMHTLAGSSVHFDHSFLRHHMPEFAARFSHRYYDVSALKLFCRGLGMPKLPKAEAHRAMADIEESVAHARLCFDWLLTYL